MLKSKLHSLGRAGALVGLAVFGALFISGTSQAESLAYPGPYVYRPAARPMNPYAAAGGFRVAAGAPVGRPMPPPMPIGMGGSHAGINTFPPIVAGVRGAVMVRGGGRPCGRPCVSRCHRGCGQRRCGGGFRCFSVSIRFGGCGGGRRGGCRRHC